MSTKSKKTNDDSILPIDEPTETLGEIIEIELTEQEDDGNTVELEASDAEAETDSEDTEEGVSSVPNDQHWMAQETITVTQELTQEEKAQYAVDMAELDAEIEELEEERDRVMKSLKKQADAKEEERRQLSKVVRSGKEERVIDCDKLADYNTGEIVWTEANPPHTEVQRRKMTAEELQFPLTKAEKPAPIEAASDANSEGVESEETESEDVAGSEDAVATSDWEMVTGTSHEEQAAAIQ